PPRYGASLPLPLSMCRSGQSTGQPIFLLGLRIGAAEAVGEESLQRNIPLADEASRGYGAVGPHVQNGVDAGSRGYLDCAAHGSANAPAIDLVGIGFLHQPAIPATGNGHEDDDNVLQRRRQCAFENILQHMAAMTQA